MATSGLKSVVMRKKTTTTMISMIKMVMKAQQTQILVQEEG